MRERPENIHDTYIILVDIVSYEFINLTIVQFHLTSISNSTGLALVALHTNYRIIGMNHCDDKVRLS